MPLAGRWIGIPYDPNGSDFDGASCWGLVRLFYAHQFGILLPDLKAVDAIPNTWRRVTHPTFGDVLLFNTFDGPHVGIALDKRSMLHVDENTTSRIESYRGLTWRHRFRSCYRYQEKTPLSA